MRGSAGVSAFPCHSAWRHHGWSRLAAEVAGIDILLSGHTHNRMFQPVVVNGATIIQSGCVSVDLMLAGCRVMQPIASDLRVQMQAACLS